MHSTPKKVKLAMAVRSNSAHWKLAEIRPRTWDATARAAGLGVRRSCSTRFPRMPRKRSKPRDAIFRPAFQQRFETRFSMGFLASVRALAD